MDIENALDRTHMPAAYKQFFSLEEKLVQKECVGTILDIGCGTAQISNHISPEHVYVGLDTKIYLPRRGNLGESNELRYLINADAAYASTMFGRYSFDTVLCLGNTLGVLEDPDTVLRQIGLVARRKAIITAMRKGVLDERVKYYEQMGIPYEIGDDETIHSPVWGRSRAYTLEEERSLERIIGMKMTGAGNLGTIGLYGVFTR